MTKQILITLALLVTLTGCETAPPIRHKHFDISAVLEQVNAAVVEARGAADSTLPKISSIRLDLQLGVEYEADGKLPIGLLAFNAGVTSQSLNKISLTFVPNDSARLPSSATTRQANALSDLAKAINAVYKALPQNDPNFKLSRGTIQLQCTFKVNGGGTAQLVPLTFGASASNQTVQSITLSFNPTGKPETELRTMDGGTLVTPL